MTARVAKRNGFTLIETLIATLVSLIVMAAVVGVFKSTSDTSRTTEMSADMQQDARGALEVMNRDLSRASDGIPPAGLPVPAGAQPACDGTTCYLGGFTYPNNTMSPVTPDGTVGANGTDAITIVYVDASWPCTNQPVTLGAGGSITLPAGTFIGGNPAPAAAGGVPCDDPVVGAKVGDVILLTGGLAATPVPVTITNVGGLAITAANGDPLNLNNPGVGAFAAPPPAAPSTYPGVITAARINVVSYFLATVPGSPLPALMRQVGAHPAVPVAEDGQNLQFTYDIFNVNDLTAGPNGTYKTAQPAIAVTNASLIRKINMALTLRSQFTNPRGQFSSLTVNSAVAPRDLSFSDRYQ